MSARPIKTIYAVLLFAGVTATGFSNDDMTIVARGESSESYRAAEVLALRDAVRQAAGTRLLARTEVSNFALRTDTVTVRAAGYVRHHTVLNKTRGRDGSYIVTVRAVVRRGLLRDDLLALRTLIEVVGEPAFCVQVQADSQDMRRWVENELKGHFSKAGFRVVDSKKGRDGHAAAVYLVSADASHRTESRRVYGTLMQYTTLELKLGVTRCDTDQVVATEKSEVTRGSNVTNAVGDAAKLAVADLFPRIRDRILRHWSGEIDTGWLVKVKVVGAPYEDVSELCKRFRDLASVKDARILAASDRGTTEIQLKSVLSGEEIADRIADWYAQAYAVSLEGPRVITLAKSIELAMVRREEAPPEDDRPTAPNIEPEAFQGKSGPAKGETKPAEASISQITPRREAPAKSQATSPGNADTLPGQTKKSPATQPSPLESAPGAPGNEPESLPDTEAAPNTAPPRLPALPVLEPIELAVEVGAPEAASQEASAKAPEGLDVLVARYGRQLGLPISFGAGCSLLGFAISALVSRKP